MIGKEVQKGLELEDVIPKPTSGYTFSPTQSLKVSYLLLMVGRQAGVKHMLLDSESSKYIENEQGLLKM